MRWKDWNTKPTFWPRSRARWSSVKAPSSTPSSQTRPVVGVSSPANRPSSVLLPLPEGPRMATKEPAGTSSVILFSTGSSRPPDMNVRVSDSQRSMGQHH